MEKLTIACCIAFALGAAVAFFFAKMRKDKEHAQLKEKIALSNKELEMMRTNGLSVNRTGNRGGCLVKVKQDPQQALQVVDSNALQLLLAGRHRSIPAGAGG